MKMAIMLKCQRITYCESIQSIEIISLRTEEANKKKRKTPNEILLMTNRSSFLSLIFILISSITSQYVSNQNSSSHRHKFMLPMHLYAGVPLVNKNHPTAPPIETVPPLNYKQNAHRYRNGLFTTRTTYFSHLFPTTTTTAQTPKYFHFRRRNRTRTTTTATQQSAQQFGIVINVYDPMDVTSPISSSTTTTASTTQSFYDRFPKIPSHFYRPPPPTVPRSFTASRRFSYSTRTTTTTTTTTTTITTTTVTEPLFLSNSSSWLFTVPSFSEIIDQYPRYPTILHWFEELSQHPNISRFFAYKTVGYTHENRSIVVAKIGLMPFQRTRRSIWLDGGIHAREWISTATILYTISRIINGTLARDNHIRKLIDSYDFYFMPVVNPDGYVYTHDDIKTNSNRNDDDDDDDEDEQQDIQRMWRKNRRPHEDCPGVDLNRNFPFAWDNRGASKFPW